MSQKESPRDLRLLNLESVGDGAEAKKIRAYITEAEQKATAPAPNSKPRSIPSIVTKSGPREAFISVLQTFDTEGQTVDRLLNEGGAIEFFNGEKWLDLRSQRLDQ